MFLWYITRLFDHAVWRNSLFHKYKKYKKTPKYVVVSPGGVATTTLIEYLGKFININCKNDSDYLKHMPTIPNDFIKKKVRIIFITENTEIILNSLERRNYLLRQIIKLGGLFEYLFKFNFNQKRELCGKYIKKQLNHYKNSNYPYLLIISFDEIWSKKNTIKNFTKILDEKFLVGFPKKKQRVI